MDFVRALKYPFDDEKWPIKFLLGSVLSLIPFFGSGYQVTVARRVIRNDAEVLPGADDLGEVLTDGVMAVVAGLVYALPVLPFACLAGIMSGISGDNDGAGLMMSCLTMCLMFFTFPYALLATSLYWMGIMRYAETGNFVSFVQFRSLFDDVRANLDIMLRLLFFALLLGLLGALISPLLLITCVGIFALGFYHQIVSGYLIGQAGIEISERA